MVAGIVIGIVAVVVVWLIITGASTVEREDRALQGTPEISAGE